jgi:hypothetical protein
MKYDEAPACHLSWLNGETDSDRGEIELISNRTVRPASLLRKSILDETSGHPWRLAALHHSNHVPVRIFCKNITNQWLGRNRSLWRNQVFSRFSGTQPKN